MPYTIQEKIIASIENLANNLYVDQSDPTLSIPYFIQDDKKEDAKYLRFHDIKSQLSYLANLLRVYKNDHKLFQEHLDTYRKELTDFIDDKKNRFSDRLKNSLLKIENHLLTLSSNLKHIEYYQKIGIDFVESDKYANTFTPYTLTLDNHKEQINQAQGFSIVYVTSPPPNPHGHTLLYLGGVGYYHIDGAYEAPKFIPQKQFQNYLNQDKRMVMGVQQAQLTDEGLKLAKERLIEICNNKWRYGVYSHNCVNFADEVVHAGGASYGDISPDSIGAYRQDLPNPIRRIRTLNKLSSQIQVNENKNSVVQEENKCTQDELRKKEGYTAAKAKAKIDPSLLLQFHAFISEVNEELILPFMFVVNNFRLIMQGIISTFSSRFFACSTECFAAGHSKNHGKTMRAC